MTSGDELLNCPFCGGAAEVREWDFPYVRFQARCVECKTTGRTRFNERAKAIAAWNHRTLPTPATDEREAVARAVERLDIETNGFYCDPSAPISKWGYALAEAALSALAPIRSAEILAAEANERARIVAWMRATSTGLDLTKRRIADAIERGEHLA